MTVAARLEERLEGALLPDKYLVLWREFIKHSSGDSLNDILGYIEADPAAVSVLTASLIEKTEALGNKDLERLEDVLKKDILLVNAL